MGAESRCGLVPYLEFLGFPELLGDKGGSLLWLEWGLAAQVNVPSGVLVSAVILHPFFFFFFPDPDHL